ncbi:M14 metallopeptidase family protein [Bowmanella sp. JS7-9]|uniref:M14 metallopeptidase family protein n=1 Tax=Pseudobowmanella zhangzhouensis TaxID=1537679 RepID=A0ABW1XIK2_9ALTE|nr:M14 metallopeptidase family protein [Bowmanella sp. JS7-9]TBX20924.1 peptidase M14 [Bowmanella sp. JS7-9]
MKLLRYFAGLVMALATLHQAFAMNDRDFLPADAALDPAIPAPASVLGYPVGTWHARHDQIVQYLQQLGMASDRLSVEVVGYTHEQRPLLMLTFTNPQRLAQIDTVRSAHLQRVAEGKTPAQSDPLVLWMGYSVHGNESSGANAALLVAYYLAASQSEEVKQLLDNAVIIMEPAINPDGLSRFAQWANMHKGLTPNSDPNHRDHNEGWPSGRMNHYWFDLNRDWLLLTHPESRARIAHFQQWRPHVLTDFHEMGSNSTFFFQPGIPDRANPWISRENISMTNLLGQYHADALDAENKLYFSEESFDDFYLGKGSSYPDVQGSIGILFEQASSRGHLIDTPNGQLSFADTIQNQVTTSLSTFRGALANKSKLQQYQADFVRRTAKQANESGIAGYVVKASADAALNQQWLDILQQHHIKVWQLSADMSKNGTAYQQGRDYFVPANQAQYPLIRSLFSTQQDFGRNEFYDVSSWNIAMAFNLPFNELSSKEGRKLKSLSVKSDGVTPANWQGEAYAYGFDWRDGRAPAMLQALLVKGIAAKIIGSPITVASGDGQISLTAGSVVIPAALPQPANWRNTVRELAQEKQLVVHSLTTGWTDKGIDLGSGAMPVLKTPRVMLLTGEGVSPYEAGEVWHYFDQQVGLPLAMVDVPRLSGINLHDYTHVIMVDGRYAGISDKLVERMKQWVREGGVLIGQKGAARWLSENGLLAAGFRSEDEVLSGFDTQSLKFSDRNQLAAQQRIAGAVFATQLDASHPLTFGLDANQLSVFRNSNLVMDIPEKPFLTVARYSKSPLLAGYAAKPLVEQVAGSAAIVAHRSGRGRVIGFTDVMNFRGYWRGSQRVLSNAVYLAPLITASN